MSLSNSERLSMKHDFVKTLCMYSYIGLVLASFCKSIPIKGNLHNIGAIQQSTKLNSSDMKKGFSLRIGDIASICAFNSSLSFLAFASVVVLSNANADTPKYSVSGSNYMEYSDMLSEGEKAMFANYPDTYRMDVYGGAAECTIPDVIASISNNNGEIMPILVYFFCALIRLITEFFSK